MITYILPLYIYLYFNGCTGSWLYSKGNTLQRRVYWHDEQKALLQLQMAISMGFLLTTSQESFLWSYFVFQLSHWIVGEHPLLSTCKKMKLIRHLIDELPSLIIDLECKATMSAHCFVQKLGNSRSYFIRYWLCL